MLIIYVAGQAFIHFKNLKPCGSELARDDGVSVAIDVG
jgi:hypothetical protein